MSTQQQHLRQRYGDSARAAKPSGVSGKLIVIGAVIVVVLLIIVGARHYFDRTTVPVSASLATYERQDDDTMRLWVDISRENPDEPAYCIVTALNYSMAEVGRRAVVLPAGGEVQTRVEVDLPTYDYPVSGGIYGCSEKIPPYMNVDDPTYVAR